MTERSEIRDRALRAMLPLAAAEGWTWATLRAGLRAAGEDPALAPSHFPQGPVGAVLAWIDLVNREMVEAAAAEGVTSLRVSQRIRRVVELRLIALAPHKAALRRALSLLALPWNAPHGLRMTAEAVDAMWHAAGDSSADFSWYTRRATLAAIYTATIAWWLRDEDPSIFGAMQFLDRRLADLKRLSSLRARRAAAA
ncbi:COQ9 family protein [Paracraurococcus lichenis]|uniref:COQ9 family protein n=1 Tax=Paracraurococcus lichenis TaxID=3064888 RepID=A0ABT9DTR4_9PROT|nr:COQ9 family protein [Paracraurococcus sp. LOR1-02]MDO9707287.1 COQ9 family protein [Paracraurococcus sp. LOR1-02]